MTQHKVGELTGPMLDGAVAMAEGLTFSNHRGNWCLALDESADEMRVYEPSQDWEFGGPLIERERIGIEYLEPGKWAAQPRNEAGYYAREPNSIHSAVGRGPTPLVAAMRAYVASKLGETVELR